MSKILYGTDPECFSWYVRDGQKYGLPPYYFRHVLHVPASDDEKHPVFLENKSEGWKAHEDGVAFEFSVYPSHDPKDLFDRVQLARKSVEENILQHFPQYCEPTLQFIPTIGFEVKRWKNEIADGNVDKEDFDYSTRFGCDPDMDEFDTQACRVMDVSEWEWRYAGGHMHVSGSPRIAEDYHMAVRCLVLTAGLAAVFYSDVPSLEKDRTFRYGKPGKYRVQNYGKDNPFGSDYQIGIEYRTPSATWLKSWEIAKPFLGWVEIGINNLLETSLGDELVPMLVNDAAQAVVNADQQTAGQILSYINSRL